MICSNVQQEPIITNNQRSQIFYCTIVRLMSDCVNLGTINEPRNHDSFSNADNSFYHNVIISVVLPTSSLAWNIQGRSSWMFTFFRCPCAKQVSENSSRTTWKTHMGEKTAIRDTALQGPVKSSFYMAYIVSMDHFWEFIIVHYLAASDFIFMVLDPLLQ
jgi:hypothetical protein